MKHSKKIVKDAALGEEPKVDSLRERVYQYLKDAMSAGKLRYGEFLDQDSICETLEVSKTPLRDALIRLEAEGFVTILPRKGVYINPISQDFIKSAYQIIGSIEADCLNEVFNKLTAYHVRQFEASNEGSGNFSKTMTIRNITTKTSVFTAYSCRSPKTSCSNRRSFRCAAASTTSRDASIPTNGSP